MIKTKRNRIGNVALLTGILTCLICWQNSYLFAQQKVEEETSDKPVELRAPSVTEQTITVDGKSINYTATVGYMIQTDADGKPIGYFFYTAYTKQGEDSVSRPLTFCFNGGPGTSSIYLHMLTIGPKRPCFWKTAILRHRHPVWWTMWIHGLASPIWCSSIP